MRILKHVAGVLLIIVGFIALVTPLTPGAWLMFVGLELIGVRLAFWDRLKVRFKAWWGSRGTDTPPGDTGVQLKK